MNRNGSTISSSTIPVSSTIVLNSRPRSVSKVMSPKPSVLITVSVQYTPVNHEYSRPSTCTMITRKSTAYTAITAASSAR